MIARACWWRPPPGYGALHAPDRQPLTEERRSAGDVPEKVQGSIMVQKAFFDVPVQAIGAHCDVHLRSDRSGIAYAGVYNREDRTWTTTLDIVDADTRAAFAVAVALDAATLARAVRS